MPDRSNYRFIKIRFALPVCLFAVLFGWGQISEPVAASELRKTPIVLAVRRAKPSVVNIRGEKTIKPPSNLANSSDDSHLVNGMGTGVVIDPRGYIITNYHVVQGVREIQVTLVDKKQYVARLISRDSETDLAIIKIDPPEPLQVIHMGTSSDLMEGETVVAIGNAFGYEHTVTRGIISWLHREVQVSDAQYYEDLIQTDASINPGNSGGPLLNIDGEMIGINVAVRAGAQGIGFAIPVNTALRVASKLLENHRSQYFQHGVVLSELGDPRIIAIEKESPAATAGLQIGDEIVQIGEIQVNRTLDFHRGMLEHRGGDEIQLMIRRDEERIPVQFELAVRSQRSGSTREIAWEAIGLDLRPIPLAKEVFQQRLETSFRGGLMIAAVRPQSPAAQYTIRRGDILVGMHEWETISLENVRYIINRSDVESLNPIKITILRGKDAFSENIPILAAEKTTTLQR